jgi:hypothetical protein
MYWIRRSLYECSGGKLASAPPNHLMSFHHRNHTNITNKTHPIGQALAKSQQKQDQVIVHYLHVFCTQEGELKMPQMPVTEISNTCIMMVRKCSEPVEHATYQLFGTPGVLTDKAIEELVKTERNLNHKRLASIEEFVKDKLRTIKRDQGYSEAVRWSHVYFTELEIKGINGWWNIYML